MRTKYAADSPWDQPQVGHNRSVPQRKLEDFSSFRLGLLFCDDHRLFRSHQIAIKTQLD